jgi:pullulanase
MIRPILGLSLLLPAAAFSLRVEWDAPNLLTLHPAPGQSLPAFADLRLVSIDHGGKERELALGRLEPPAREHPARLVTLADLDLRRHHRLEAGPRHWPVIPDGIFDGFDCSLPLGATALEQGWEFRLFAPRALGVELHLYARPDDERPLLTRSARREKGGSWQVACPEAGLGMAWTWSLRSPHGVADWADGHNEFADPWATAVATRGDYRHDGRALLVDESHSWRSTDWSRPGPESLIIVEAHLRDLTAGPAAGLPPDQTPGSYEAFWRAERGGLAHLVSLGATAVEFLPLQDFGNLEIDWKNPELAVYNDWNPWERNHWGYMPSYFFAPESYYATGERLEAGRWTGLDGRQCREFKELVDRCHEAGLAVLVDVVYNHVSQYDNNPLKAIDPAYWFRFEDDGSWSSGSGCGNDLHTERPLVRRLILDSVRHWLDEYRVDGFRFDLGAMLDDETLRQLHELLRERGAFHTAEPWGGGRYEPERFARLGFSWWNDRYRVDLRGRHGSEAAGFLFGRLHPESSPGRLAEGVQGAVLSAGGCNPSPLQAINYVAAHDDHDFADWVKLALGLADEETRVPAGQELAFQTLTEPELAVHRLAALHLLSSAGVPMIHSGQELGRSKIIAPGSRDDSVQPVGSLDHNSYEKDNATNWIDWRLLEANAGLLAFWRETIAFRRARPELATAPRSLLAEPDGARLAWHSAEAGVAAAFHSAASGHWELELPPGLSLALHSGEVRLEGRRLQLGPRSGALLVAFN